MPYALTSRPARRPTLFAMFGRGPAQAEVQAPPAETVPAEIRRVWDRIGRGPGPGYELIRISPGEWYHKYAACRIPNATVDARLRRGEIFLDENCTRRA